MPERKIGTRTFKVEKLPASRAIRTLAKLTKMVGPGIDRLQKAIAGDPKKMDGDILPAIAAIIAGSDPDTLTDFVTELAETAEVKLDRGGSYDPVVLDLHFSDNLMEAITVVAWVLEVNFRDFFVGGQAALSGSKAAPVTEPA